MNESGIIYRLQAKAISIADRRRVLAAGHGCFGVCGRFCTSHIFGRTNWAWIIDPSSRSIASSLFGCGTAKRFGAIYFSNRRKYRASARSCFYSFNICTAWTIWYYLVRDSSIHCNYGTNLCSQMVHTLIYFGP